jgi:protein-L-isoaspartate(D-aspartate) O-methyltransferase
MQTYPLDSDVEQMIQSQLGARGIRDQRVLDAVRATPRDAFFPDDAKARAYEDAASSIGHGQTISQPYVVALMTHELDVQPTHRVLEIGTGSGYQTAILARLAQDVYTVERVKPLLDAAFERVLSLGLRNVHFKFGDGFAGWAEQGPFDRIILTCAPTEVPRSLLMKHLTDGGIAVLPVGEPEQQELIRLVRRGDSLEQRDLCPVRFVPMIAGE